MEIKSTEFFRNLKSLPQENTKEFEDLINWEVEKCLGGVTLNGVKFPGWLYFHYNHWWIRIDQLDNYGNVVRIESLPQLRDNEWIRAEALEECRLQKKGYMEIGLRQGGKSEFEASITGYNATLFKNTQNVIVGGNDPDLTLLKDKVDFGIKKLWKGIGIPKLDKNWRNSMVRLGFKETTNEDDIWSYLIIRNAADGNNTETAAGTTAKCYVMDEVGKYLFGQVFEAAKPAFLSEFGWRTIPVLVGTGGSFDNGADAERFFYNPEANNFLSFDDELTGVKTCLFMSGLYRQDCKYETTLTEFLKKERNIEFSDSSELDNILIKIADKELAKITIETNRKEKAKDPDQSEYLKQIMYYPLTPEECFLSESKNIYNTEAAKKRQKKIYDDELNGYAVEIYHDGEKLTHKSSNKRPISTFPVKRTENKDAPIIMWEPPIPNPPYGLYVAGVDPYRFDEGEYADSLGAVYIYKRRHSISGEKFQDMFVASYVARPKTADEWSENALNLIKYYNATAMVENDEPSFIKWIINKGEERYLADGLEWLKARDINTTSKRAKGIHRSNENIRKLLRGALKEYLNEKLAPILDEEGNQTGEYILGVSRVCDPMLLEEIIKFNPDINVDREVAASIAVSYANDLDPIIKIKSTVDPRLKSFYTKPENKSVFTHKKTSMFSSKKRPLFR